MKRPIYTLLAFFAISLAACGGGGGGGASSDTAASDPLAANFIIYWNANGDWIYERVEITQQTSGKNSDGEFIYTGNDPDVDGIIVSASWSPTLNQYLITTSKSTASYFFAFYFTIEGDGRLSGTVRTISRTTSSILSEYAIDSSRSHRYESGSWGRTAPESALGAYAIQ